LEDVQRGRVFRLRVLAARRPLRPGDDGSFREDASRIRCNPAIFARLRSFASNILRFNGVENVCDTRYRITLGGLDALCSLRFM
jgi:hypothetical protein